MGRVSDWIVSSFQLCISCVSGNDVDVRPAKAKNRKPRKFWMIKSAAVSPQHVYPKEKSTTNVSRTHAGDFPCTKGRPLPKPFTSGCKRGKVDPAKATKKIKGAHPCKGCVNAQHDPYKIKLRLSSKVHQRNADEHVSANAGDKDLVMKRIDQEVREKVDKMFGKSETVGTFTNRSNGRVADSKSKKNGLHPKPMKPSCAPGYVRTGSQPRRKDGIKHMDERIATGRRCMKGSRSAVTGGEDHIEGYCSHDDDDDIVIGNSTPVSCSYKEKCSVPLNPDEDYDDDDDIVIGNSTPVPCSYKQKCSVPLNPDDDHDDDDDIVIGNSTPVPCSYTQKGSVPLSPDDDHDDDDDIVIGNSTPVPCSYKQKCSVPLNRDDDHDDDDDIVIRNSTPMPCSYKQRCSVPLNAIEYDDDDDDDVDDDDDNDDHIVTGNSNLSEVEDNETKMPTLPKTPGFAATIIDIANVLGEMKSHSCSSQQSQRHMVNMLYGGGSAVSNVNTGALSAFQTTEHSTGYAVVIKDLANKLGEMKSTGHDAQSKRKKLQTFLQAGDIPSYSQFQSLARAGRDSTIKKDKDGVTTLSSEDSHPIIGTEHVNAGITEPTKTRKPHSKRTLSGQKQISSRHATEPMRREFMSDLDKLLDEAERIA
ncbi:uncharacterized protein LOC124143741 [Haliotis rufescens]|uniref:uncharacterized protein LOC124143741 n=1 Tax=Haliotis rufescens TaxID=6454 RepID=UPI00201F8636|nr:uncharacterized protein LOC124143741 [Haliotis rufescens]XP_048238487.1 uncharacterized protein LOC124143741 [Haliotis rufescens]